MIVRRGTEVKQKLKHRKHMGDSSWSTFDTNLIITRIRLSMSSRHWMDIFQCQFPPHGYLCHYQESPKILPTLKIINAKYQPVDASCDKTPDNTITSSTHIMG